MQRVAMALAGVVAVVAAVVLGLFLWLRTYAPLAADRPIAPGSGLGAYVEPTFGSGGKTVFLPTYSKPRVFTTRFVLDNGGRFAVTVLGVGRAGAHVAPLGVQEVRIDPRQSTGVEVRWRLDCTGTKGEFAVDTVRIRYRYLSLFSRTQSVELPFAVTLRCSGAPPASP